MMDELHKVKLEPCDLRKQINMLYGRLRQCKGAINDNDLSQCTYCKWICDDCYMEHQQCIMCQAPVIACDSCHYSMVIEEYQRFVCRDCIKTRATSSDVAERDQKLSDCVTCCHCCNKEPVSCEGEGTRACPACCQARLFDCDRCKYRDDMEPHRTLCPRCERKEPKKREKVRKNRLIADAAAEKEASKKRTEAEELESDRATKRLKSGDNDNNIVTCSNAPITEI